MSGNTFGKKFSVTTFGESHGLAIGGVIDGCPPGIDLDLDFIQSELDRRRPGQSEISTQRKEPDKVEFLSGVFDGKTTGTPLGFVIKNTNQISEDYDNIKNVFRPSSADYTYFVKYGRRDYRGGGRASARETAARVAAGAIAKLILRKYGVNITAYTSQIGDIKLNKSYKELDLLKTESNIVRCPDQAMALLMIDKINKLKSELDSIGGVATCVITGVPAGIGEPVFDKLNADIAKAMMTINAAKGIDFGFGFDGVDKKGSELNDEFINNDGKISTLTNHSGGIQGGISNGEDIFFRVLFKPPSSIAKHQKSVDLDGNPVDVEIKGRHDPCIVPRAIPVVEAMAAIVIADFLV